MNNSSEQLIGKHPRIEAVDALRGFAVMAILLVHNLEHFIFPVYPADSPGWLNALDQGVFNVVFTLFAGKAYAIFALLFGFTFYIQSDNLKRRGGDFGYRFLWRLVLLAGFATLNAAFFPAGDVLLLFVVAGLVLFFTRNWGDGAILAAAVVFLLQPVEWYHCIAGLLNPAHRLPDLGVGEMYARVAEYTKAGNFGDFILGNVTLGQKASLLWAVNAGRFVQTAAVDPKARAEVYDTETMGPMLRYVIAHEVGHTLGLMHNMRGSYAYPVDSLRSPSFTEKYGTTASIMDYARNNYVAQPGDGVTQLLPPHLGLYDYYAIKWAYQPIFEAKTPEEEVPVLNRWIDEKADDPIYIYGEQAIFGATDPASQTESLGDDAMKATEYGIRNLKIVVDSLHLWTAYPGKDYNRTEKLYEEVFKQARRYLGHVMVYLGGSYRYYPMVGSDQPAFEMVSKQKQKEALNFIFDKLYELPDWYVNPQLEKLTRPKNEDVTDYQMSTVRTLLLPGRIARMETNAKLTPEDAYSASEYVDDIYNRVWASTLKNRFRTVSE